MRTIYSSEQIRIEGVQVLGVQDLQEKDRTWVLQARKRLLKASVLPESVASRMFAHFEDKPVRQAFFRIRGRTYFLDFFFPLRMIAVEIDGSAHKFKKAHDRQRDADFRSIGIRTIRIKNKYVMDGRLYEQFFKRFYV